MTVAASPAKGAQKRRSNPKGTEKTKAWDRMGISGKKNDASRNGYGTPGRGAISRRARLFPMRAGKKKVLKRRRKSGLGFNMSSSPSKTWRTGQRGGGGRPAEGWGGSVGLKGARVTKGSGQKKGDTPPGEPRDIPPATLPGRTERGEKQQSFKEGHEAVVPAQLRKATPLVRTKIKESSFRKGTNTLRPRGDLDDSQFKEGISATASGARGKKKKLHKNPGNRW